MAIADGLICQIYPVAGEAAIKNIVDGTILSGTGTPTLVDEGAEKAWSITTGTLLTAAVPAKNIIANSDGGGVTIAVRFKATSNGSGADFLTMIGVKDSADNIESGVRITRNGNDSFRGRRASGFTASLSSMPLNNIYTLVYTFELANPANDFGRLWVNTVGRVGTDANASSPALTAAIDQVFNQIFINCQNSVAFTLLDFAYWNRELTSAEAASVADGYRSVMPAPSGDAAPTGIVTLGTPTGITSNSAAIPYFYSENDNTGFEYRVNGGSIFTVTTSPLVLTGLAASTFHSVEMRAVNGSASGDWSDPATFTTSAGADVDPPTFTVAPAVTGITQTTATATATINETGNIYYVVVPQAQATPSVVQVKAGQNVSGAAPTDSGSALATTTLSDGVTGLTAGQAYKACFAAEDDETPPNIQATVTVVNFSAAAVAVGTITSQPLSRNNGISSGVVALTYIDVDNPSTGALVLRKTGVSTNGSGVFSFSDAAITTGTEYRVNWLEAGGQFGTAFVVAS